MNTAFRFVMIIIMSLLLVLSFIDVMYELNAISSWNRLAMSMTVLVCSSWLVDRLWRL